MPDKRRGRGDGSVFRLIGAVPPARPESEWSPTHRANIERLRVAIAKVLDLRG